MCAKCHGTGLRPLTEEEYHMPGGPEITISPTFGPEGQIGVSVCPCECDIGRIKLAEFKRAWHAAFLGCGTE